MLFTATCTGDPVVCSIDHLAAVMGGWDWNTFIAALLGALVGALALLIIFWLERRERGRDAERRHDERFEAALAQLMAAMGRLSADHARYLVKAANERFYGLIPMSGGQPTPPRSVEPSPAEVLSLLEVVQMLGDAEERAMVAEVAMIMATLPQGNNPRPTYGQRLDQVNSSLRLWRTGEMTPAAALTDLRQVTQEVYAEARALAKADELAIADEGGGV